MRRLYGRVSSINVQKVAWALAEIGLEFEWVDKNGTVSSIDSPNYRKINPAAQIPTFDDNGTLLRQSNAIVRYLAHSYPEGKLYPTEPEACAEADYGRDGREHAGWIGDHRPRGRTGRQLRADHARGNHGPARGLHRRLHRSAKPDGNPVKSALCQQSLASDG